MREIKFRAWDPEADAYRYGVSVSDGMAESSWGKEKPEWILEQFTGLHDRNGKEIYEGDILHVVRYGGKVQTRGEVFEEKGSYRVRNGYAVADTDILGQYKPNIIEIMGNIHESSELLT